MITMPKPNSPASAMVCVYDAWNRMVEARNSDGSIIATYRYDGLTRRIRKLLGPDPGNPTATYDYYHNPARQVLETRKNGSANPYKQYVWGLRYVHSPVCRFYDPEADGANVEKLYYTNDANFNVTGLVGTDGAVVERYTYDPYGKVTFRAADWSERATSAYANEVLFTGHRLDTETGLYYGGWRYYHPTLGCWIGREAGYRAGMNLQAYCLCSPIGWVDPMGMAGEGTSGQPAGAGGSSTAKATEQIRLPECQVILTLTIDATTKEGTGRVTVGGGIKRPTEPAWPWGTKEKKPEKTWGPKDVTIGDNPPGPIKKEIPEEKKGEGPTKLTISVTIESWSQQEFPQNVRASCRKCRCIVASGICGCVKGGPGVRYPSIDQDFGESSEDHP